jgi:hypothetical protein
MRENAMSAASRNHQNLRRGSALASTMAAANDCEACPEGNE